MSPIFTIGHSTLTEREFVTAARGIDVIIDVRSHPGSRHVPQFNKEEMEKWLPHFGLAYEWRPHLGGWAEGHNHDPALTERMASVGVDVAAYARGLFPKHRIGVDRPVDQPNPTEAAGDPSEPPKPTWTNQGVFPKQRIGKKWPNAGKNPICPLHGYSLRTTPESQVAILADAAIQPDSNRRYELDVDSRRHLHGLAVETLSVARHNKHNAAGPHCSAPEQPTDLFDSSLVLSGDGVLPRHRADCNSPPAQSHGTHGTPPSQALWGVGHSADNAWPNPVRNDSGDAANHNFDKSSDSPSSGVPSNEYTNSLPGVLEPQDDDSDDKSRNGLAPVVHCTCDTFARTYPEYTYQRPAMQSVGLHDYSWYMTLPTFLHDMDRLIAQYGARSGIRVALICCEALWWKCHRSMLADYLTYRQVPCFHLPCRPPKRETTPRFKPHPIGNRLDRYPVDVLAAWVAWNNSAPSAPVVDRLTLA